MQSLHDDEAERSSRLLSEWLNAEDEDIRLAVDGGDFGRPVTPEGITSTWSNLGSWVERNRSRQLVEQHSLLAYSPDRVPVGHVEVNVMRVLDAENNCINSFCGAGSLFAILGNIMVVPHCRGKGIGTQMIRDACEWALTLPSAPERVVVLVKESYSAARRFYRKAGFLDSDWTMSKADQVFRLVSRSGAGAATCLVEDLDAQRLASWLVAESKGVQLAVDGGEFGRPLSADGIVARWRELSEWMVRERGREMLSHRVFSARYGDCAAGHVEVAVVRSIDPGHSSHIAFCGLEPFAVLLYVYVLPQCRGRGVGSSMVRQACEFACRKQGAAHVVVLVQETHADARRFYSGAGFEETGLSSQKMGSKFLLISYRPPDAATASAPEAA